MQKVVLNTYIFISASGSTNFLKDSIGTFYSYRILMTYPHKLYEKKPQYDSAGCMFNLMLSKYIISKSGLIVFS